MQVSEGRPDYFLPQLVIGDRLELLLRMLNTEMEERKPKKRCAIFILKLHVRFNINYLINHYIRPYHTPNTGLYSVCPGR